MTFFPHQTTDSFTGRQYVEREETGGALLRRGDFVDNPCR